MPKLIHKRTIFVVMPFSSSKTCTDAQWTETFELVFAPSFQRCGYKCVRAETSTGSLIKSIVTELRSAWIVLADLTDRNANVFYDLGVRHSLSRRTILVARDSTDIPSDLRGYWWLLYGTQPREVDKFKNDIKRIVEEIERQPERSDSPISDFLDAEMISVNSFLTRENSKKLSALFTELSGNINTLNQVAENKEYANFINVESLGLLLTTLYVDIGPELLRECHELRHALRAIHSGLRIGREYLESTRQNAEEISRHILDIKTALERGSFSEPGNISTMVWQPLSSEAVIEKEIDKIRQYSTAADLTKVNIDALKKHLSIPKTQRSTK